MNYILGTGSFGAFVLHVLRYKQIKVDYFIDQNPKSTVLSFCGLPVKQITEIAANSTIYIASNRNNHQWIESNLLQNHRTAYIENELSKHEILYLLEHVDLIEQVKWSKQKLLLEVNNYFVIREIETSKSTRKPVGKILSLDLVLTERCTLKCVDCSNLMQYYEKPSHIDSEQISFYTNLILNQSYIQSIRLIGGEPLLHPGIARIIDSLPPISQKKYGSIEIYTNGTLIPKDELINSCLDKDVIFYISDYGNYSRNLQQLKQLLQDNSIRFAVETNLTWQDCGRVVDYNPDNIDYRYANCCVNKTLSLIGHKLYSCPFSANFHNIFKDEEVLQHDCIDLSKVSDDEVCSTILDMQMSDKPLSACFYCKGRDFTVDTVPVAVQTKTLLQR